MFSCKWCKLISGATRILSAVLVHHKFFLCRYWLKVITCTVLDEHCQPMVYPMVYYQPTVPAQRTGTKTACSYSFLGEDNKNLLYFVDFF